jgi:hypothetical protein
MVSAIYSGRKHYGASKYIKILLSVKKAPLMVR